MRRIGAILTGQVAVQKAQKPWKAAEAAGPPGLEKGLEKGRSTVRLEQPPQTPRGKAPPWGPPHFSPKINHFSTFNLTLSIRATR